MATISEMIGRADAFTERHHKLVSGTIIFIGTAIAANKIGAELVKGNSRNEIRMLPPTDTGTPSKVVGLAVPSFGNVNGEILAKYAQQYRPDIPWLYCVIDNSQGIDVTTLATDLESKKRDLGFEEMDVVMPSFGFRPGLEIARLTDTVIRDMVVLESPIRKTDARGGRTGHLLAKYAPDPGPAGKFFLTLFADTAINGLRKTPSNFVHSLKESVRGGSLKLMQSELALLGDDIFEHIDDYSKVIQPGITNIIFAGPGSFGPTGYKFVQSDGVIYVEQSFENIKLLGGNLGVRVIPAYLNQYGHLDDQLTVIGDTLQLIDDLRNRYPDGYSLPRIVFPDPTKWPSNTYG